MPRSICDQSPESRAYLEQFAGSHALLHPTPPVRSADEALERLQSDDVSVVLEIPPNFGRDFRRGAGPRGPGAGGRRHDVPRRDRRAVRPGRPQHRCCRIPASGLPTAAPQKYTADIEERYMYNPTFESIYSIVPSVPALLLLLIPAILMTVSIVREKELGSMINFYVTPTGRLEYLLGKQLPYIAIGMINFFILAAMALIVFGVPIKGSFLMLTLCTLLYVMATTGIGMVTSTFTNSQVAAVFVTAILTIVPTIQFSGLLQPVSTLEGNAAARRLDLAGVLLHALQPGRLHQGARARPHDAGHPLPGLLHPGPAGHQFRRPEESRRNSHDLAAEHLLARAQGDPQPAERHGDGRVRHLRVHPGDLHPGDRDLERGQQRLDRLRGRGRVGPVQGAVQRLLPAALQAARDDRAPSEVEDAMDRGRFMFVVAIPPRFEHDLRAGPQSRRSR